MTRRLPKLGVIVDDCDDCPYQRKSYKDGKVSDVWCEAQCKGGVMKTAFQIKLESEEGGIRTDVSTNIEGMDELFAVLRGVIHAFHDEPIVAAILPILLEEVE